MITAEQLFNTRYLLRRWASGSSSKEGTLHVANFDHPIIFSLDVGGQISRVRVWNGDALRHDEWSSGRQLSDDTTS